MSSSAERGAALLVMAALAGGALADGPGHFGYGRVASPEQIARWDIDVRPDGLGLPPGRGSVSAGEPIYESQCAHCHGSFGEGVGSYPALAGGEGSLRDRRPRKTVGSFWRFTSTLWDYIRRAMPFAQPGSLSDEAVYAVTAYVLYLNDIVAEDFVLTRENLSTVRLPNERNFVPEQRPDTQNARCMRDCRDPAHITVRTQADAFPGYGDSEGAGKAEKADKAEKAENDPRASAEPGGPDTPAAGL